MAEIKSKRIILLSAIFFGCLFLSLACLVMAAPDETVALKVEKSVKNLSRGDTSWYQSIGAEPLDVLVFKIKVSSVGTEEAQDVMVKDALPAKIIYRGELKIDDVSQDKDISEQALNIGNLALGESRIIIFRAQVDSGENFFLESIDLINTAIAYNTKTASTATSKITVAKKVAVEGPTDVKTGITNSIWGSLLLPLGIALLMIWIFSSKLIGLDKWAEGRKKEIEEYRAKKKLKKEVAQLKAKGYFKE